MQRIFLNCVFVAMAMFVRLLMCCCFFFVHLCVYVRESVSVSVHVNNAANSIHSASGYLFVLFSLQHLQNTREMHKKSNGKCERSKKKINPHTARLECERKKKCTLPHWKWTQTQWVRERARASVSPIEIERKISRECTKPPQNIQ